MTDEEYIKMKMNENVLQKVTPTHTKDWYIKWAASIILLVGMLLTANQIYPLNIFVHLVGLAGWLFLKVCLLLTPVGFDKGDIRGLELP